MLGPGSAKKMAAVFVFHSLVDDFCPTAAAAVDLQ